MPGPVVREVPTTFKEFLTRFSLQESTRENARNTIFDPSGKCKKIADKYNSKIKEKKNLYTFVEWLIDFQFGFVTFGRIFELEKEFVDSLKQLLEPTRGGGKTKERRSVVSVRKNAWKKLTLRKRRKKLRRSVKLQQKTPRQKINRHSLKSQKKKMSINK